MHRTRRRTLLAIGALAYRGPARRDDAGGSGTSTGSGSTEGGSGSSGDGGNGDGDQGGKSGQGDDTGKTPKIQGDFDKERYERTLAAAREGERKAKDAVKAANDRVAAILKAAGLTPDGKEDPAEQLKAARESAEKAASKARQSAVELAVYKHAGKAGADADAVLDSRAFLGAVADLDPEAADFSDKVTAAIKAALKANPKLAAGTAGQGSGTGRQGADHTGGSGGRSRSASLTDAVTRKLGG
jgi:hypothetical protein